MQLKDASKEKEGIKAARIKLKCNLSQIVMNLK